MGKLCRLGLLLLLASRPLAADGKAVPRTILALYDSQEEGDLHQTRIHRLAELPLNHLGLVVRYQDTRHGLPPIKDLQDVRGILTWFLSGNAGDPERYIEWAESIADSGRSIVVLGQPGLRPDVDGDRNILDDVNRFLALFGLRMEGDWNSITYNVRLIKKDANMVEFERPWGGILPSMHSIKKLDGRARSYLIARRNGDPRTDSHLVVVGPRGAFTAEGYTHSSGTDDLPVQWYLNPFRFFRLAYRTGDLPKPDVTTLSGRRIFFSHLDGDGWSNASRIDPYKKSEVSSAAVVLKEILEPYPDLPVTVAPIVADLRPDWHGRPDSLQTARRLFALPQVEAASHGISHPLSWTALENSTGEADHGAGKVIVRGDSIGKVTLLQRFFHRFFGHAENGIGNAQPALRTYDRHPFSLEAEILESISFISSLLPAGRKVQLFEWSGDSLPSEAAVAMTRRAGVRNLNGGSTLFDRAYLSHAWIAPIGRQVGNQRQIYASNIDERTYGDMGGKNYYSFKHWVRSQDYTGTPLRLKPLSIYYHMYAGERPASLNAVRDTLNYARGREVVPISASRYAGIADGFYTTRIIELSSNRWRIEERGRLSTIRFDDGDRLEVDFDRSKGVLGQRHTQGSLYVALDEDLTAPVIALRRMRHNGESHTVDTPYLVEGRWRVWGLQRGGTRFTFSAQGFGRGEMVWRTPPGHYVIQIQGSKGEAHSLEADADAGGKLTLKLGTWAVRPATLTVSRTRSKS